MRNILILFILLAFVSCKKEEFLSSPQHALEFSTDTILFDTIFTKKGSITRICKLYNPHKGTIVIDEISVANQQNLEFFINVNGISSKKIEDIHVQGGDSLFVFVQAKLTENSADTALAHTDSLLIKYNTLQQKIVLHAWGQNVENIRGLISENTTLTSKIPYVVYDSLVIPHGTTLTIQAGAKLYMHYNANIIVHGTLKIEGTKDKPVLITNDRLEPTYQLLPGQWGSLIFTQNSSQNSIVHAIIKNGTNGIVVNGSSNALVDISISQCEINTMSSNILFAQYANTTISNSVLYNCNYYVLAIMGGKCNIIHSTVSNFGTIGFRNTTSSVVVSDYNLDNSIATELTEFNCFNSIIVGQTSNEISLLSFNNSKVLPCVFDFCLIKDSYSGKDTAYYKKIVPYDASKKLFKNAAMNNFSLDTLSQAKDIGKLQYAQSYEFDKQARSRIADSKPDVGAFEYYYEAK